MATRTYAEGSEFTTPAANTESAFPNTDDSERKSPASAKINRAADTLGRGPVQSFKG